MKKRIVYPQTQIQQRLIAGIVSQNLSQNLNQKFKQARSYNRGSSEKHYTCSL